MPGVMRNYTLTDVLQGIYSTATGLQQGVSTTSPGSTIALTGEVDEQMSMADSVVALSAVSRDWNQDIWGCIGWS